MPLIVLVKAKTTFFKGYVQNQVYKNGKHNVGNAGNRGNVMFRGMLPNIPSNVPKHSGKFKWLQLDSNPKQIVRKRPLNSSVKLASLNSLAELCCENLSLRCI